MQPIDRTSRLAALLIVATVAEAMLLLLPVYVGALVDGLSLSDNQLGILASADLAGISLATFSAFFWIHRVDWRKACSIFFVLLLLANIGSLFTTEFFLLTSLRTAAGLAGGAAYALALAGICRTVREDRNAALMVCGQVIFGSVGAFLLPVVSSEWQLNAVYLYMVVWVACALLLVLFYFPENPGVAPSAADNVRPSAANNTQKLFAIAGTGFYFLTVGAVWAFLERIARDAGLDSEQVSWSLGMGYLISLLGSGAAAWLGMRLGTAKPMLVSGVVQITMLFLFTRLDQYQSAYSAFFAINAVFQFFWSYIIAYQIVVFSRIDRTGQFVAFYGTSMHLALAIGPFIGAMLVKGGNYSSVLSFGMVTLAFCYTCYLLTIYLNYNKSVSVEVACD